MPLTKDASSIAPDPFVLAKLALFDPTRHPVCDSAPTGIPITENFDAAVNWFERIISRGIEERVKTVSLASAGEAVSPLKRSFGKLFVATLAEAQRTGMTLDEQQVTRSLMLLAAAPRIFPTGSVWALSALDRRWMLNEEFNRADRPYHEAVASRLANSEIGPFLQNQRNTPIPPADAMRLIQFTVDQVCDSYHCPRIEVSEQFAPRSKVPQFLLGIWKIGFSPAFLDLYPASEAAGVLVEVGLHEARHGVQHFLMASLAALRNDGTDQTTSHCDVTHPLVRLPLRIEVAKLYLSSIIYERCHTNGLLERDSLAFASSLLSTLEQTTVRQAGDPIGQT